MEEYRQLARNVLTRHGCGFVRHGKGGYGIWYSPTTRRHVTVDGKAKSRHTANAAMKQSGIGCRFD